MKYDVYRYSGQISVYGYHAICDEIKKRKEGEDATALLMISTPGGDPDAGFRIARALQHAYPENGFHALISNECKSAGTLVVVGAKKIYMADRSELGPLDIQIKKGDELFGRNSGLDINQAVDFLKDEALTTFNSYMNKLVRQGLSTKVAADMAVKLVSGLFQPIAAQIEPLRLAEMQRATNITYAYGRRLSTTSANVKPRGVETLIGGYPSHSFVIDRKEARTLFKVVDKPDLGLLKFCDSFDQDFLKYINDPIAKIDSFSIEGYENGAEYRVLRTAEEVAGESQSKLNGTGGQTRRSKTKKQLHSSVAGADAVASNKSSI